MNNTINDVTIEESEVFFRVISELNENDSYKAYINSALPNEGVSIEDICAAGFEQYKKNYMNLNFS